MLIVTSKVKKKNKEFGFSTSAETLDALTMAVDKLLERGRERARKAYRKTVMARDVSPDVEMLSASSCD